MTIINFKIDEEKKKKIEEITKLKGYKSVSDFIRQIIEKEMDLQNKIDNFLEKNPPLDKKEIDIPDYIPDGKYLGISRNSIVAVGDSAQEVASILAEKFPDSASGILHKGHESETIDFVFSIFSLDESKWYHQYNYKNNYYPLIPFSMPFNDVEKTFMGLIDTGATISALDKNIIEEYSIEAIKKKEVYTANGIIKVPVYKGLFRYEGNSIELEFISTKITGDFTFHALLGKNFIDKFNILLLGREKLLGIQMV